MPQTKGLGGGSSPRSSPPLRQGRSRVDQYADSASAIRPTAGLVAAGLETVADGPYFRPPMGALSRYSQTLGKIGSHEERGFSHHIFRPPSFRSRQLSQSWPPTQTGGCGATVRAQ